MDVRRIGDAVELPAHEERLEPVIGAHLRLVIGKAFPVVVRWQAFGWLDGLVAVFAADAQVAHGRSRPPEEHARVVVCGHGDVQIERDVAAQGVVVQRQGAARAQVVQAVPHVFEAPVLVVRATVAEPLLEVGGHIDAGRPRPHRVVRLDRQARALPARLARKGVVGHDMLHRRAGHRMAVRRFVAQAAPVHLVKHHEAHAMP